MAISGIGSIYNNVHGSTYASQNNEAAKKAETKEKTAVQSENSKSSTSTNNKVSDYNSYLSKNYDCVKNGSVAISGSYLRQCANDSEKAKELEKTLSLYNDIRDRGYANAKQNAQRLGARLVSYSESWSIDSTGNVTMQASVTVTSDNGTKGWKELAEEREEKLKEKKEKAKQEEKLKEQKLKEQKLKEQKLKEQKEETVAASKEAGDIGVNMDLKI